MTKRVQARVSGRVQGVGFRYYADHVAEQLGLAGTVRNTADGGVEAVAEGDEASCMSSWPPSSAAPTPPRSPKSRPPGPTPPASSPASP